MKALATIVKQFGPARKVVTLTSIVSRSLAPNGVMVRMLKCAINPSDIITISGAYQSRVTLPFFPGYEGVGVIEEIGDQVTGFRIGDRVLPLGSAGCWQELKVAEAKWCFRMSDGLLGTANVLFGRATRQGGTPSEPYAVVARQSATISRKIAGWRAAADEDGHYAFAVAL
jgi:D-arabinose 1-dehydrogenase-like Zn-dependent alcohol dehydrogenase